MQLEYAKLPVEELKAHYLAAKAALFAAMGGDGAAQGASPAPAAPPAGPPAGSAPPVASPSPAGPSAMAMSETPAGLPAGATEGNGGKVEKSEVEDLKAQVEAMAKIVSSFVNRPVRKAVTEVGYVAKSEEAPKKNLSSAEVTAKLSELTRSPDLKKSDREVINRYYEGSVKFDAIEHLLK